jgi:hypothetical protein
MPSACIAVLIADRIPAAFAAHMSQDACAAVHIADSEQAAFSAAFIADKMPIAFAAVHSQQNVSGISCCPYTYMMVCK